MGLPALKQTLSDVWFSKNIFQIEKLVTVMSNPRQYKIPDWFLNRQKDIKDGKFFQVWTAEGKTSPILT